MSLRCAPPLLLVLLVLLTIPAALAGSDQLEADTIRIDFTTQVQNLQAMQKPLFAQGDERVSVCPELRAELRYGWLPFRLPDEEATSTENFLSFVVAFGDSELPTVLLDFDQDQQLGCDEKAPLVQHPRHADRAFRTVVVGGEGSRPRGRYRLTVPTSLGSPDGDYYSVDIVDVPVARSGAALFALFDGNHNGIYDRGFGDGVLVNSSGDRHLSTDPYGGNFHSYHLPLRLPGGTYEVVEVDPAGAYLTLARIDDEVAAKLQPLAPGDTSDVIECVDSGGRPVRIGGRTGKHQLLHFWLSHCGSCEQDVAALAPVLKRLGPERLTAVGISLDETAETYRAFVEDHRPDWPQCFVGAMFWDNPIAVRFGVMNPSDFVLLDPEGQLLMKAHHMEELMPWLENLWPDLVNGEPRAAESR